jgi:hypothetical protein
MAPKMPPGGGTTYPQGRNAPVSPRPGAPNEEARNPLPNSSPLPRNPDDLVKR